MTEEEKTKLETSQQPEVSLPMHYAFRPAKTDPETRGKWPQVEDADSDDEADAGDNNEAGAAEVCSCTACLRVFLTVFWSKSARKPVD
jgi:hypothetical protein